MLAAKSRKKRGKQKEYVQSFEVLIYPRLVELLFIVGGYVAISVAGGLVGLLISTAIFALFMVGYFSDIKKASAELRRMVR